MMLRKIIIGVTTSLFSFGYIFPQMPGNVSSNIQLWLKANAGPINTGTIQATDGQAVNIWTDKSLARSNNASAAQLAPPNI